MFVKAEGFLIQKAWDWSTLASFVPFCSLSGHRRIHPRPNYQRGVGIEPEDRSFFHRRRKVQRGTPGDNVFPRGKIVSEVCWFTILVFVLTVCWLLISSNNPHEYPSEADCFCPKAHKWGRILIFSEEQGRLAQCMRGCFFVSSQGLVLQ